MVGESAAVMGGRPGVPVEFARPLLCQGRHAARAVRAVTLDLARETGVFLAVGSGPDASYRVARAGSRWKGQLYLQEGTCSQRSFQILLQMDLLLRMDLGQPARCRVARERWRSHPWPSLLSSRRPSGWREGTATALS